MKSMEPEVMIVTDRNAQASNAGPLEVPDSCPELRIDLSKPRIIRVWGYDKKGRIVSYDLKVTGKGRLVLL